MYMLHYSACSVIRLPEKSSLFSKTCYLVDVLPAAQSQGGYSRDEL